MKKLKLWLVVSVSIFIIFSCAKKDPLGATAIVASAPDGSQSMSQLAGMGTFCSVESSLGTALGDKGAIKSLLLNANGTYTYAVYYSDHVGCATAQASGGNNVATYTQSGTFAVSGAAATTSPIGTNVIYTVVSTSLTIHATTSAAQALANWMNGNLGGGSGCSNMGGSFSGSTNSALSMDNGVNCVGTMDGAYSGVTFPAPGDVFKNINLNTGSVLESSARAGSWRPGTSSFGTSYSEGYLSW